MVGYDDSADALTLGDDDVLTVGDYEIAYDSGANEWQAEYTPSGDVASVPKNQSGSLFPTDFADALAGQALADDGNLYSSIQDAINNSSSWVFVGPGTYYENVVIDKDDFTLQGAGYDTLIDGGDVDGAIKATSNSSIIKSLRVQTSESSSNTAIFVSGDEGVVENVTVSNSGHTGITLSGNTSIALNCTVESHNLYGINANSTEIVVKGCNFEPVSGDTGIEAHIDVGSDCIISNNIVSGGGVSESLTGGIRVEADDNIVIGNRIINSSSDGITVTSSNDNIIANNRISGSSGSDLTNNGTGTVTDANLTGPSN